MKKLAAIILLVFLAACTRTQTSIQKPPRAEEPEGGQLREIAASLPEIQGEVTVHEASEIMPEEENPFSDII